MIESVASRTGVTEREVHPEIIALDQPIVVCGSVNGSGPVASGLLERGFIDVVHVEGGFPAWQEAGLPTDPPVVAG